MHFQLDLIEVIIDNRSDLAPGRLSKPQGDSSSTIASRLQALESQRSPFEVWALGMFRNITVVRLSSPERIFSGMMSNLERSSKIKRQYIKKISI